MKALQTKTNGRNLWKTGLFLTGILFVFIGTLVGHDLAMWSTISPVGGTTITETETTLTGQFGTSGCGLGGTINVSVETGSVSAVQQYCDNQTAIWHWSADWSGYDSGDQTVLVTFETHHGGNDGLKFAHLGAISATYHVLTACDLPDAPAIANHYMHDELGIRSRNIYNTIIPQVAHAMNSGTFGENACSPGYAAAVEAYVDQLLN